MKKYEETIELFFELKGSPESTKESYYRRIQAFSLYLEKHSRLLDHMEVEDIQQYILYLKKDKGLSAGTINNYISAIKFFYTYALQKEWNSQKIPRMKRRRNFPVIPSKEEVINLINHTNNLKHKAIFMLIYGSGLRVSEVVQLKINDICSKTMRIRVNHAKHNSSRYTILSQESLIILRQYFKKEFASIDYRLDDWLFPGKNKIDHYHVKSIKNTFITIRDKMGLNSNISAHTLRHCFATHALEDGVDPVYIQQLLGHKRPQTTNLYLHMTSKSMMGIKSPLDTQGNTTYE